MANSDERRLVQRQIYLPPEDDQRITDLVPALANVPSMRALVRSWSDAARLVITEGLAALEARYGVGELAPEHYPEFAEQEYA